MAKITYAGESLIAQKLGAGAVLNIARFIFANVPGLDPQQPINRAEVKPPAAQIVHTYTIPAGNSGYVNPNQVVYSSMLGSDLGDFDFNWMGLESAEGVLFAVAYLPVQQKRRNIPPAQIGNNITRNILVEFSGAQELTGITINANTWQHDFTVRLAGIDERERQSNRDMFGRSRFFAEGFQVEKVGSAYRVKAGIGYVEGVRVYNAASEVVSVTSLPALLWLDVALERRLNDVVATWRVIAGESYPDYKDSVGVQHYCVPLGYATAQAISDVRAFEGIGGPLIDHFAARVGDYPYLRARATTKVDVGLSNIPNAVSDDPAHNSSDILATTKAVMFVQQNVDALVFGTKVAGKAAQLANARNIAIHGDATGAVWFDATQDVSIGLTLANTGVMAGSYPKVWVNSKGQVVGGNLLVASDIPSLSWSKIVSDKPTTLDGYGITNALRTGYSNQVPRFYSPETSIDYKKPALELREVQLVGAAQTGWEYCPRLAFHWSGMTGGDLVMNHQGTLCWNQQPIYHTGNFNPATKADKATTLAGYGITDALRSGYSNQIPHFYSPVTGTNYANPALELREALLVGAGQLAWDYAPRLAFTWSGVTAGDLAMNSGGLLCWNAQPLYHTGNFDPATKANKATTLAGYGITDALKRGDHGLGNAVAPVMVQPESIGASGGFGAIHDAPSALANFASVLNIPFSSAGYTAQLAVQQGQAAVRLYARAVETPGKWTPTVELYHTGNLAPTKIVPAGTLVTTFSRTPPTGCLRANGAAVSRAAYPDLFASIGTLYGAGDGVSTFNLPDTRGLFIRDVDDGRGFDLNRAQSSVQLSQNIAHIHTATTGVNGWHAHAGSSIAAAGEHTHTAPRSQNSDIGVGGPNYTTAYGASGNTAESNPAGLHTHGLSIVGDGNHNHSVTVDAAGGNESRPVNIALHHYIKY